MQQYDIGDLCRTGTCTIHAAGQNTTIPVAAWGMNAQSHWFLFPGADRCHPTLSTTMAATGTLPRTLPVKQSPCLHAYRFHYPKKKNRHSQASNRHCRTLQQAGSPLALGSLSVQGAVKMTRQSAYIISYIHLCNTYVCIWPCHACGRDILCLELVGASAGCFYGGWNQRRLVAVLLLTGGLWLYCLSSREL